MSLNLIFFTLKLLFKKYERKFSLMSYIVQYYTTRPNTQKENRLRMDWRNQVPNELSFLSNTIQENKKEVKRIYKIYSTSQTLIGHLTNHLTTHKSKPSSPTVARLKAIPDKGNNPYMLVGHCDKGVVSTFIQSLKTTKKGNLDTEKGLIPNMIT